MEPKIIWKLWDIVWISSIIIGYPAPVSKSHVSQSSWLPEKFWWGIWMPVTWWTQAKGAWRCEQVGMKRSRGSSSKAESFPVSPQEVRKSPANIVH
jgi:hypothetical protein